MCLPTEEEQNYAKAMASDTEHSPVGASGRHRWSMCPGSVRLCKGVPSYTSRWARDGQICHLYAAEGLRMMLGLKHLKLPPLNNLEMFDAIQEYVRICLAYVNTYPNEPFEVFVEEKFHVAGTDGYGTVDFALWFPRLRILVVVDLKYGAGVEVAVEENEQLLYYAGTIMMQKNLNVSKAILSIVQPRSPLGETHKQWVIDGYDLFDDYGKLLSEIRRTQDPNAPLVSGEWCRWCPANPMCPARRQEANQLAAIDFTDTVQMNEDGNEVLPDWTPEILAKAVEAIPRIEAWCKKTRLFAYHEALAGRMPPGLKFVTKRKSPAKWKNETEASEKLAKAGVQGFFKPPTLKTPAQVKKGLSKDQHSIVDTLTERVSSGIQLVPEADKRPAISMDAAQEFGQVLLEEGSSDSSDGSDD